MGKVFLHARSTSQKKADPYATLTVYCPLYSTIRAESVNTSEVLEKVSYDGEVTFERMSEGEWDITFVGVEHAPIKRITIGSLDYELTLDYFEASVTITYPVGSTCVATDGKNTLMAPNASGRWDCTIRNTGTWTITSTYGDKTASTQVVITRDGQTESVELDYFEATINVTYPVGSTCTASNGSTTLLAPDTSGSWVCTVHNTGTWNISSTYGNKSDSKQVTITSDGQTNSVTLDYFEATINITYPAGSTCTVSNGSITLLAPDITGTWTCIVSLAGTWTISCVDGAKTVSEDVVVDTDGEAHNVKLNYRVTAYSTEEKLLSDIPIENTVGIVTTTAVTSWEFTNSAPTNPMQGKVWVVLDTNGSPMSAMQYSGISWTKVTAKIYQNNTWKPFRQIIIPNTSVTWTQSSINASIDSIKATNNEASTVVEIKHRSSNGSAGTAYMISSGFECAAYSILHIEGILSWDNSGSINNTIQRIRLYRAGTNTEIGIAYINSTEGTSSGSVNINVDYDISSVSDFCLVFESNTWDATKYITCTFEITNSYLN